MSDLVSVLIPVYNAENEICKCVKSLLNQTYANIEIIMVDDCSTDNSYNVGKELSMKDDRIFIFQNANNMGCAATINQAFIKSKGTIIAIVDNDDYVEPDYIEYLVKNMYENEADISICGWYNDDTEYILSDKVLNSEEAVDELLLDSSFRAYYWNKLYKRDILGEKLLMEDQKFEDMASMPYIFRRAKKIYVGREPKYHYVSGLTNFSSSKKAYINYWLAKAYYERLLFVIENGVKGVAKEHVIRKTCQNSIGAWRQLKKDSQQEEASDLYKYIKKYKKVFLSAKSVGWKHKIYILLRIW